MTVDDRLARVKRIFSDAADLPHGQRTRFLQAQCGNDAAVRGAGAARAAGEQKPLWSPGEPLYRPTVPPTSVPGEASLGSDDRFLEHIGKYRLLRKIGGGGNSTQPTYDEIARAA